MALLLKGATLIDGVGEEAAPHQSVLIDGDRISHIGEINESDLSPATAIIDCTGRFLIPGLMNANVHLMMDIRLETLVRFEEQIEDIIIEAAQVALANGLTTVFDTWGPRRHLAAARGRIDAGEATASRIRLSGNIVGLDGPFSQDFLTRASEVASPELVRRVNATWAENTGRHLLWQTPEAVAEEVRAYIGRDIDFLKYASNGHGGAFSSAFLAFSEAAQRAMVEEARAAGITVQAHATSVEGLRVAVEAGCDIIQHANLTGPVAIPQTTLAAMAERAVGAVIFPFTQARIDAILEKGTDADRTLWGAADQNLRNLIASGAPLLMANDGFIWSPGMLTDPMFNRAHTAPGDDNLFDLALGHFAWFRAMEEKGCAPMTMLRAATRNVAEAYGMGSDLGTIEVGKIADILVLERNPLASAANYQSISEVIKAGRRVDRKALPERPILTRNLPSPSETERLYKPFLASPGSFPPCPLCLCHQP